MWTHWCFSQLHELWYHSIQVPTWLVFTHLSEQTKLVCLCKAAAWPCDNKPSWWFYCQSVGLYTVYMTLHTKTGLKIFVSRSLSSKEVIFEPEKQRGCYRHDREAPVCRSRMIWNVSYKKKAWLAPVKPILSHQNSQAFFWYHNDKDLKACISMTQFILYKGIHTC